MKTDLMLPIKIPVILALLSIFVALTVFLLLAEMILLTKFSSTIDDNNVLIFIIFRMNDIWLFYLYYTNPSLLPYESSVHCNRFSSSFSYSNSQINWDALFVSVIMDCNFLDKFINLCSAWYECGWMMPTILYTLTLYTVKLPSINTSLCF